MKYKKHLINLILIFTALLILVFTYNNAFLYKTPVMKITDIKETFIAENTGYGYLKENYYHQEITGVILNGTNKGLKVTSTNERSSSLVYDEKYKVGEQVFVNISNIKEKTVTITNYKRDVYVVMILLIFVLALYFIGKKQGICSLLALGINIFIYCFCIHLYTSLGISLFFLSIICTILFTIISLFLSVGRNKKALATVLSTLISVAITIIIGLFVMYTTKESGVRIEQIDFLITPYKAVFVSELLLGGLGAIMDIAITICSTVNELLEKNNKISTKKLYASCREIGKDTMGTMLNVLLFTYICTEIPKFVLYYRNGFSASIIMKNYLSIDIVRSLVAGIGIVLAIPITSFIAISMFKGRKS